MPTEKQRLTAIRDLVICAAMDARINPGDIADLFGLTAPTVHAISGRRMPPLPGAPSTMRQDVWGDAAKSRAARRAANREAFQAERAARDAARRAAKE